MKEDAFDRYEQLPTGYHKDPRWKQITKLRKENTPDANAKANGLVFQIRADWGFDG